ncbi:exocyst complex component sec6 [Clavulina sp. PMI_390]|nr:exocyst complex component sec6 [Clavulina sp. PMI_390]
MSTVSAAQAVGEFLQSPDDLMKIVAFRKRLEKEKASIDLKLGNGVRDQLDAIRDGLRKLISTRENVNALKEEIRSIEALFNDDRNNVKTFDQISRVSVVHRNFTQTSDMVANLTEMYSKLSIVENRLAESRDDILGPSPYLLWMHHQLNALENFRNQTMHLAKPCSADVRNTLKRHFERLDNVVKEFEAYLFEMAAHLLEIVREGNGTAIVKLIKIAELEGREDEKAIGIKLVKKAAKIDAAAKFKSLVAESRRIKHYRSSIMTRITETINAKFKRAFEEHAQGDPNAFLEDISWMYQDLIHVQTNVAPLFPEDWQIYGQWVRKHHKALDGIIKKIVDSAPDATTVLALHKWLKQYKKDMKDPELEIDPEWVTPALLGGKEQALIDDYAGLIIRKLDEWTANYIRDDTKDFTTRTQNLEVDADGRYGMERTVIFWQMINQQVDLALDSGQGAVLAKVVSEISRVIKGTQETWSKLVDAEAKKQMDAKNSSEAADGLVEFIIAVANDQVRSAEYAETLSTRIEDLVSDKYRVVIRDSLNSAIDGYIEVLNTCTQSLINLIFNDLKPATKALFAGQSWYDGIIVSIIETMRDYMGDYQQFLNPEIIETLVQDLIDTFIVTYLTAFHRASKLRMPIAGERMRDDIAQAFLFFQELKDDEGLENSFEVLEMAHALLTASRGLVFLSFWNFAKVHGPNIAFVEGIMKARDDLDRSAVSEVMESVKRKVKEENIQDPREPTIMKKIVIQSAISAFLSR